MAAVLQRRGVLFMGPVSWHIVHRSIRLIFAGSVRTSAVSCFTVILMMRKKETSRREPELRGAVRERNLWCREPEQERILLEGADSIVNIAFRKIGAAVAVVIMPAAPMARYFLMENVRMLSALWNGGWMDVMTAMM